LDPDLLTLKNGLAMRQDSSGHLCLVSEHIKYENPTATPLRDLIDKGFVSNTEADNESTACHCQHQGSASKKVFNLSQVAVWPQIEHFVEQRQASQEPNAP
jgi:hypothetical protein